MNQPPKNDLEPFDPSTMELNGLSLVEASAGTGKTYSLTQIYLRLIIEKKCNVRDLLVMTFTRAATAELRERIRKRLIEVARWKDKSETSPPEPEMKKVRDLIKDQPDGEEKVYRRLIQAASRMDETSIFTIDGFVQKTIADFPMKLDDWVTGGALVDDEEVFRLAVTEYWVRHIVGRAGIKAKHFRCLWSSPKALYEAIESALARPRIEVVPSLSNDDYQQKMQAIQKHLERKGEDVACVIDALYAKKSFNTNSRLKQELANGNGAETLVGKLKQGLLDSAAGILLVPEWALGLRAQISKTKTKDMPTELEPLTMLEALIPSSKTTALAHALREIQSSAKAFKAKQRQFSYTDANMQLLDAMENKDFARQLREKYPWALVDEFQDTNAEQYQILSRIYDEPCTQEGAKEGGLIMIGDPKQAIYRFRGADVHTYLRTSKRNNVTRYTMTDNYRSVQPMVDALNILFSFSKKAFSQEPFVEPGIEYQRVTSKEDDVRLTLGTTKQPIAPLTIWRKPENDPDKLDTVESAHQYFLKVSAQQIKTLLAEGQLHKKEQPSRPIKPEDIAILVQTNSDVALMRQTLLKHGVKAVCLQEASVFSTSEARDILRLVSAAHNPMDQQMLFSALMTDLLGFDVEKLGALHQNPMQMQKQFDRFDEAHRRWRSDGIASMLLGFVQQEASRILQWGDGESRMGHYLHLTDLLQEKQDQTAGSHHLIDWLARMIAQPENDEQSKYRIESDEPAVRISTLHKAKGLEYGIVLVPFAYAIGSYAIGKKRDPGKPPYVYHDGDQTRIMFEDDPGIKARSRSIIEHRGEGVRQLYVALTRAKFAVFLGYGGINQAQNSALSWLIHKRPNPSEKKTYSWFNHATVTQALQELKKQAGGVLDVKSSPDLASSDANKRHSPTEEVTSFHARSDVPELPKRWSVISYTSLTRETHHTAWAPMMADQPGEDEPAEEAARSEKIATTPAYPLPRGAALGIAVHQLLEQADFQQWPKPGEAFNESCRERAIKALKHEDMIPDHAEKEESWSNAIVKMIAHTLHTPLSTGSAGVALAEIGSGQRVAEMEFFFTLAAGNELGAIWTDILDDPGALNRKTSLAALNTQLRGMMNGSIDLVFQHDHRFYIVDYKTNHLADYNADTLERTMCQNNYDIQYLIYQVALHRYLGTCLNQYDPDIHLGGIYYLFTRGMDIERPEQGVYFTKSDTSVIRKLDEHFS